jgi:hypothetical protein
LPIIESNKQSLSNSNAMPKTKFPRKPVNHKTSTTEQNARVSHKIQSKWDQIKTSNFAFYPTDSSASPPPPLYSGGIQRNYFSWGPAFAAVALQAQVQVLNHHLRFGKSPPSTGVVLAVASAA